MLKRHVPIFATPLIVFEHPDPGAIHDRLEAELQGRRSADRGLGRSNRGGWHSATDFFERPEPASREIARFIVESLHVAEERCVPGTDFTRLRLKAEGWANINPTGALNTPHSHPGYSWSGVYYVRQSEDMAGERSGMIEFLDPRSGIAGWPLRTSPYSLPKLQLRPAPGTLLMFPSYLVHWVYPNAGASDRITVAFNARFDEIAGATG